MKRTPLASNLPKNWEWVRLDDLLIEKPCNGLYKSTDFIGQGILFLDINGLYKGLNADFSQARRVEVTDNEYSQYELAKGDILFNRVSKVPEGVGKAVVVGELHEPAVYESNMIRVRLDKQKVDSLFVVNYLSTNQSRRDLLSKANISNQASINQQAIKSLVIPLPPINEQYRIVKILDRTQSLISKRKEAIALLDTLTQSIFIEMFGDPVTNPKGWDIGNLLDIADFLTGYPFKSVDYTDKGETIKLCRGANVLPNRIDWSDLASWSALQINSLSEFALSDGDVVIAMDRPWISEGFKIAQIQPTDLPALLVQRVARLRGKNSFSNSFIFQILRSPIFTRHCKPTETTIPHISPKDIKTFRFPIAPLQLQKEFAQRVEAVEKLKATHHASLSELQALFASLQHRAFRGEL